MQKLTKQQIIDKVKSLPTNKVKLAITDIDGVLRGKVIHLDKFLSILDGGFGFCNVIFGWDVHDECYKNGKYTGWHSGYPDAKANIDFNTFRQVPWDNDMPFFLADFVDKSGDQLEICPRSLLKKIKSEANALNIDPIFSQEFEWFNFRETSESLEDKGFFKPTPLTRGMFGYSLSRTGQNRDFFNDIFDHMTKFNVPIEGLHTETGPGVYEAAITYNDILESADRAVLFKAGIKEIGHMHGIMPTFMAKFSNELPGCGGHIHQSLWSDGKNIFHDENDKNKMSETMKHYIAGILHCLPEILPMFAPTINSYKRLVEGAWAPTTPNWGIDNRTVALRALPGGSSSSRVEHRVVGSDVNPYLAMAGSLASGLYGIKNKLKLEDYPQIMGNGYEDKSRPSLASNLGIATDIMKKSELAQELFGKQFVEHFTNSREHEWNEYMTSISDWELKRYFEII